MALGTIGTILTVLAANYAANSLAKLFLNSYSLGKQTDIQREQLQFLERALRGREVGALAALGVEKRKVAMTKELALMMAALQKYQTAVGARTAEKTATIGAEAQKEVARTQTAGALGTAGLGAASQLGSTAIAAILGGDQPIRPSEVQLPPPVRFQ